MEYNVQQQEAITAPLGPMVIVAGPGTGKTATLVGRINYLVERSGLAPERILAITFTRKAAAELRRRVTRSHVTATTIHALALQLLREIQPEYVVTDETLDQVIPDCIDALKASRLKLAEAQNRWQYVLVDEFQDVDARQAELIDLLVGQQQNLCVVGDPDQSIYGFRGARLDVLLRFQERYPHARQYMVSENYRSQANIVEATAALIGFNKQRIDHRIVPTRTAGSHIVTVRTPNGLAEAKNILQRIHEFLGASDHLALERPSAFQPASMYSFSDIAIVYRLNAVGDHIEEQISASGLPYHRIGKEGVLERVTVRDFIAHLPEMQLLSTQPLSQQIPQNLRDETTADFVTLVEAFDDLPTEEARKALLDHASIARPEDDWQAGRNAITLLTAHAAKGLEFPIVFIVGAEEGIFPYTEKAVSDIEEERRLFYVAMTRAQDELFISSAEKRSLFGGMAERAPSRFLAELPAEHLQHHVVQPSRRPQQTTLF